MKLADIEIPPVSARDWHYRFFEILPGLLSLLLFLTPIILSIVYVPAAAFFIIAYILILLFRASGMSIRLIEGHSKIRQTRTVDWENLLEDFYSPNQTTARHATSKNKLVRAHVRNMQRLINRNLIDILPSELYHVVIVCTYNESQDIIHPTIESVINTGGFTNRRMVLILAYEQRASEQKKRETLQTLNLYKDKFYYSEAIEHTLKPDEIPGKGANATHAGRQIAKWANQQGIEPSRVLITTLDSDNRPDKNYFSILTYTYLSAEKRKQKAYQPVAIYNNNIWDVPAIMRLCAIANTYFHTANSVRPHALRNFSAHSQSLELLIDTDFWSVRTIVEDGHQFWRCYFRYDGDYEVLPIFAPIYQDAVFAGKRFRTAQAQFKQLRRWTYGASDVAYVATRGFFMKNKVNKWDLLPKFSRLLESHVGWATSAPLLLLSGYIPAFFYRNAGHSITAQQLPKTVSIINTVAIIALLMVVYIGIATLPKRPSYHKRRRSLGFLWQWILTPIVGVVFNSMAALNSQFRLAFKRYLGTFEVTEKAVREEKKVSI